MQGKCFAKNLCTISPVPSYAFSIQSIQNKTGYKIYVKYHILKSECYFLNDHFLFHPQIFVLFWFGTILNFAQGLLLSLRESYEVQGIQPVSVTCKTSTLFAVLSIWFLKGIFNTILISCSQYIFIDFQPINFYQSIIDS